MCGGKGKIGKGKIGKIGWSGKDIRPHTKSKCSSRFLQDHCMLGNVNCLYIGLYPSGVVGNQERRFPKMSLQTGYCKLTYAYFIGHS